jgi:hypothetical protein
MAKPRLSVSQLKAVLVCPQYAHFKYVVGRGVAPSTALTLGSLWHLAMASHLEPNSDRQKAYEDALATAPNEVLTKWDALLPALETWRMPDGWEIVQVEQALTLELTSAILIGTPDTIVRWNGGFWHLQHKTLAPGIPLDVFGELTRTDWHECVYELMLAQAGFNPVRGTILNIVRKLSAKTIAASPHTALSIQYITRTPIDITTAMGDVDHLAHLLYTDEIYCGLKNRAACAGPYRNHLCEYKPVCDNQCDLADPRFIDLESRYEQPEAPEE